jgi:membrane-associated phospholipid phosphatase
VCALVLAPAAGARAQVVLPQRSHSLRAPSRGTWLTLVGLGAAAAAATTFQNPDETADVLEESPLEGFIDAADGYGNGLALGIGTAGLLALGHLGHHPQVSAFGDDLAESLFLSSMVVWAIKPTVDATRPNGGHYSFPSGHTAAAFSTAPVIWHHLGWKAGLAAYTVASITGLARMEDRSHYLSDVLFGAAIGIASGREVVRGNGLRAVVSRLSVSGRSVAMTWDF